MICNFNVINILIVRLHRKFARIDSEIGSIDREKWSEFVRNHPDGNIFQTPEMFQLYGLTKHYQPLLLISFKDNNDISGILLAVIQKEATGIIGRVTSRSIIMGAPLTENRDNTLATYLLAAYKKQISGRAIYSQVRNVFDTFFLKESFEKAGFGYEAHLDILIDLRKSISDLESEIHKERKRNISRAVNKDVEFKEITEEAEIKRCTELIKKTYQRIQRPCLPEIVLLKGKEILHNNIRYFGAFYEGKLIASRIVLCYKSLVYDWYAGTDNAFLNKYPNDFLPWQIILWAKEHGYETFDFGGAGKPGVPYGVRDFKQKFGGELVSFGRYNIIHNRLLFAIGRAGFKIYRWI